MFTENGPVIAAEFRGGYWDVTLDSPKAIGVPTLVVMSEESPQPFREVAEAIADTIPGAQSCLVPGGHLISPGIPPVVDFVATVLSGAGSATALQMGCSELGTDRAEQITRCRRRAA